MELLYGEIVFFRPTEKFWDLLAPYSNKIIVEVGCGAGFLSRLLHQKRYRTIPIDLQVKKTQMPGTYHLDACDFPYIKEMAVLIARPSHGAWVAEVIHKATQAGATVIYVGLEVNLGNDLYDTQDQFHRHGDQVGEENEILMVNKPVNRDEDEQPWHAHKVQPKSEWCLLKTPFHNAAYWWEDKGDDCWYNCSGGHFPKGKETVLARVSGEIDYDDLDHTKTGLVIKEGNAGWLDPDGKFYPCDSQNHDPYARLILRKKVDELEQEGWARIYSSEGDDWICINGLTDKQAKWLDAHDHPTKDYQLKSWRSKVDADEKDLPKQKPPRPFKKGRQREGD